MRRHLPPALAALLLLGVAGPAHAAAKCVKLTAALTKKIQAASAASQMAFAKALAKTRLTMTALVPMTVEVDGVLVPGQTVTRKDSGQARTYVVGPMVQIPNGQRGNPSFEFVTDAAGDVWLLVRKPNVKSRVHYTVCGCGPVGSGAMPRPMQLLYELPDGVTFRGEVTVGYDAREVIISYTNRLPKGGPCPQPP